MVGGQKVRMAFGYDGSSHLDPLVVDVLQWCEGCNGDSLQFLSHSAVLYEPLPQHTVI